MAIEIVDFPIKNGGSFHGKMLVHQRVSDRVSAFISQCFADFHSASECGSTAQEAEKRYRDFGIQAEAPLTIGRLTDVSPNLINIQE